MGGGGGFSGGITPEDLNELKRTAREELKKGAGDGIKHVFISFAHDDLNEVNLLRGQAKNDNCDIQFDDHSLRKPFDSKDADYIKRGIIERIRQSSVTVVYVSEKTAGSKWVNWEVEQSLRMGKKVVAMHKGNSPPAALPKAIRDNDIKVVQWNQKLLSEEIG